MSNDLLVKKFELALERFNGAYVDPYADAEDRGDAKRALTDARNALLAALAPKSKELAGPLALLRDAHDLLDSHLGDSEVEYVDEDEEREYAPVQVAARFLAAAIQALE